MARGNEEQIQGIAIGLSVDATAVKEGIRAAREAMQSLPSEKTITLRASVSKEAYRKALAQVRADVATITKEGVIPVGLNFQVSKTSVTKIQRDIRAQMPEGINLKLRYAPSATEKIALRNQVIAALQGISVPITVVPTVQGATRTVQSATVLHEAVTTGAAQTQATPARTTPARRTTRAKTPAPATTEGPYHPAALAESARIDEAKDELADLKAKGKTVELPADARGRRRSKRKTAVLKPLYSGEEDVTLEQLEQLLQTRDEEGNLQTQQVIDIVTNELAKLKAAKPGAYRTVIRGLGDFPKGRRKQTVVKNQMAILQSLLERAQQEQDFAAQALSSSMSGKQGGSTRKTNEAILAYQQKAGLRPRTDAEAAVYRRKIQDEIAQNKRAPGSPLFPGADVERYTTRAQTLRREESEILRRASDRLKTFGADVEDAGHKLEEEGFSKSGLTKSETTRLSNIRSQAKVLEQLAASNPVIAKLSKQESTEKYEARVGELQRAWDQGLNEVLAEQKPKAPEVQQQAQVQGEVIGEKLAAEPIAAQPVPGAGEPTAGYILGGGDDFVVPVRVMNVQEFVAALRATGVAGAPRQEYVERGVPSIERAMEIGYDEAAAEAGLPTSTVGKKGSKGTGKSETAREKAQRQRTGYSVPTLAQLEKFFEEEIGLPPSQIQMIKEGDRLGRISAELTELTGTNDIQKIQEKMRRSPKWMTGNLDLAGKPWTRPTSRRSTVEGLLQQFQQASQGAQGINVGDLGLMKPEDFTGRLDEALLAAKETQQFLASRAPGTALGQGLQQAIGGRATGLLQVAKAERFAGLARAELRQMNTLRETINLQEERIRLTKEDGKSTEQLEKDLGGLNGELEVSATRMLKFADESEDALKGAANLGTTLKNVGLGLVASLGTTTAFVAGFAALAGAGATLGYAMKPTIDSLFDWNTITPELTKNLAGQIREMHGATQAALAQKGALSGLTAAQSDIVNPFLEQRASIEAGNMALSEQVDMIHAARNIAVETARQGGMERGLTQGTGGFLGTGLFGIRGTQELLASGLRGIQLPGQPFEVGPEGRMAQAIGTSLGGGMPLPPIPGLQIQPRAEIQATEVEFGKKTLDFFNAAFERGGAADVKLVAAAEGQEAAVREVAELYRSIGADTLANQLEAEHILIRGVKTQDDAVHSLQALTEGINIPDAEQLLRQLRERIIPARLAGFRAESELQRQVTIPAQFALQRAAQPPRPFGTTFSMQGVGAQTAGQIGDIRTIVDATDASLQAMEKSGRDALMALVPRDQKAAFGSLLAQITQVGAQIRDLEVASTQAQVNQQTKEYNNQIRIANRSLQDAKDIINGINGAQGSSLGIIEGQNIALQRQSQRLSFIGNQLSLELQQRKINFQVALAGFVAPGTTPEEKAARVAEAEAEAAYAQQQLDLQKQQLDISQDIFQNQIASQQISLARNLADLQAQVGLLQSARDVSQFVAASSEAINKLNTQQQQLVAMAGTYIEEGAKIQQQAIQTAVSVAEQTGAAFSTILGQTSRAWNQFLLQARIAYNSLMNPYGYSGQTGPTGGGPEEGYYASGFLGTISGATQMVVGEAGPETVAVLRNPRTVPGMGGISGGGGSTTIVINFHDPVVREEADLERMASLLVTKVEEGLGRRTSLLGFRAPN